MSTQELVAWIVNAGHARSASYVTEDEHKTGDTRLYKKTASECLTKTRPATATDTEYKMANILYREHLLDCQDWHKEFSSNT